MAAPGPSIRLRQVESVLRRTISEVLQRRISDPRIMGMVSITRVEVADDLRDATVYVSVLPQEHESKTIHGLRHAAGHIQRLVRKAVTLRSVPHLHFRLDASLKKQAQIHEAIRQGLDGPDAVDEDAAP